jgi:hypothetical protein
MTLSEKPYILERPSVHLVHHSEARCVEQQPCEETEMGSLLLFFFAITLHLQQEERAFLSHHSFLLQAN